MDTMDFLMGSILCLGVVIICVGAYGIHDELRHEHAFALGSVVTTTAEYEYLTNDSFTGVVVRGEGRGDPALTVRNRGGAERRIATEFLEPME